MSGPGQHPRPAAWIAVDWGTSRLRAWPMDGADRPLARLESEAGMAALAGGGDWEGALLDLVAPWLASGRRTPVIVCGMAGADEGWAPAPYRKVPCAPLAPGAAAAAPVRDPRLEVAVLPGLAQDRPPDVMRGEETQIAGLLALRPGWDGVLCLPGTHCKWAEVSAGEVVSFRSFLTGELHALLAGRSVLRHALGAADGPPDRAAFLAAVDEAMGRPAGLLAELFSIRAARLLGTLEPAAARARLSGLLIGLELAGARPWWLGREVIVLAAPPLAGLYVEALAAQGVQAARADADAATLAGLAAARRARAGAPAAEAAAGGGRP